MGSNKLVKNYAGYNAWANIELVNYLKTKPQQLLSQSVVSSFPSIIRTLTHILDAQEFWISIVSGIKNHNEARDKSNDVPDDFFNLLIASSTKLEKFVKNLSEVELKKEISTPWIKNKIPIYEVFQHCFNHSTYHRGQLVTIFKQFGFEDIPSMDYSYCWKIREDNNETITDNLQ